MKRRRLLRAALLGAALLVFASPAAAHPLGNATANRAVSVTVVPDELRITYVLDLAEIPAYAAMLDMDTNTDGRQSPTEQAQWAAGQCDGAAAGMRVAVSDQRLLMRVGEDPKVTFPPGVGGLETLRLVCPLAAPLTPTSEVRTLTVTDTADDGRRGWREITIAPGEGVRLTTSDVPAVSPSNLLVAYPDEIR